MRYALISDIHANQPALEAVLADIQTVVLPDTTLHLGDLVGYAPWPNEVVERLTREAIAGVAGNYDSTVAADHKHCGCKYEDPRQAALARRSYEWTREHCTAAVKSTLAGLPFRIDLRPAGGHRSGPKLVLVHGTPTRNTLYWSAARDDDFCRKMAARAGLSDGDAIAFGHTHKPWTRVVDGVTFINTGSVGRPKDGDWRAGYVVVRFHNGSIEVEFRRLEYDIDATAEAILASGLPDELADYLRSGGASPGSD